MNRSLRGPQQMRAARRLVWSLALLAIPATSFAGVKVFDSPEHTLELGMRLQPRMEYEMVPTGPSSSEARRDFLIRRARLKANGKMQGVAYGFEWKIDGTDQFGATPTAAVENAWFQYPLGKTGIEMRVGLYDQPFSRDRLTSDSRQLAVDRGTVSNVPDALGLADNAVGFHFYGKTKDLKVQYALGAYDNRFILANRQDSPMFVGRMDFNLAATKDIYQDGHFGETDRWYCLGINGSYQGSIENAAGLDDSTNSAVGVDGMMDIPFGKRRLFVRGELNAIRTELIGVNQEHNTTVKMLEAGVMFNNAFQPFVRFDQQRGDAWAGGNRDITYAGANFYQRGHSLKIQGDLRFQAGSPESIDGMRLQAQMDF